MSTQQQHASTAVDALESMVEAGIYATGAQLYVEIAGDVVCDVAVGHTTGEPVGRSTLHCAYCATKPLVPLAIAHLMEREGLDLSATFESLSIALPWVPPETPLADLLTHAAGMGAPSAAQWRMTPPDRRPDLFRSTPTGIGAAYSEISAWEALAVVIETVSDMSAEAFVETAILQPAGLIDDVVIGRNRAVQALEDGRIQVPVAGLPIEQVPLLSEALPQQLRDTTVAFGGLINASGLGRLYTKVRAAIAGERVEGMPSTRTLRTLLAHRRAAAWDATLRRRCSFAGGFMVDLEQHGITTLLPDAIGHSSGIVPSFGLCDVRQRLAMACCLNGVTLSSEDLQAARTKVVGAVLASVGG